MTQSSTALAAGDPKDRGFEDLVLFATLEVDRLVGVQPKQEIVRRLERVLE